MSITTVPFIIVYRAFHPESGKSYVGITKKSLHRRITEHACSPTLSRFQTALRQFGRDSFQYSILDFSFTRTQACQQEKFWIALYDCRHPIGFNQTSGGEHGFNSLCAEAVESIRLANTGRKRSPEAIAKTAAKTRGRTLWNEEQRKELSRRNKGRKRTPEQCAHASAVRMGVKRGPQSPETVLKRSLALRGRKLTPEHRAKMSAARKGISTKLKGIPITPERRAFLASLPRRIYSQETLAKMSAARKGRPGPKLPPEHYELLKRASHTPEANAKRLATRRARDNYAKNSLRTRDEFGRYTRLVP